ncbi:hypothetical protein FRC08_000635 [Ceratobasidium sp. 394]|nr:hypothetical protein FRC08_000635 [Ceratobasidium sp. 394]
MWHKTLREKRQRPHRIEPKHSSHQHNRALHLPPRLPIPLIHPRASHNAHCVRTYVHTLTPKAMLQVFDSAFSLVGILGTALISFPLPRASPSQLDLPAPIAALRPGSS